MEIDFDLEKCVIFIEVGRKVINADIVRKDLETFESMLNKCQKQINLVVNILAIPSSSPLEIPSILNSVVNFSAQNKTLVESKIGRAFLISKNAWGRTFIDMLLQRRKSNVPVVMCSSIEEAVDKF
jgi:hypothetical protein